MKKTVNAGIGGRSFVIEEDAYTRLNSCLKAYRAKSGNVASASEVTDDIEARIRDFLSSRLEDGKDVVTLELVNEAIAQLGMPEGGGCKTSENGQVRKKFYRDSGNKYIGGVCGGLAAYFDIDIMLLRIIFIVALLLGTAGFWAYLILWIVAPLAKTPAQKCELRGLPATDENMAKYPSSK